jgi:hypothetical protein
VRLAEEEVDQRRQRTDDDHQAAQHVVPGHYRQRVSNSFESIALTGSVTSIRWKTGNTLRFHHFGAIIA